MKFKKTKKIVRPGEFHPYKITIESEQELALLTALIGATTRKTSVAYGLDFDKFFDEFDHIAIASQDIRHKYPSIQAITVGYDYD